MATHTFSNGNDTNLRKLNNTNWTATADMVPVTGVIGTSTAIEAAQSIVITDGEGAITAVGTATRLIIKFADGSLGLVDATAIPA